MPRNDQITRQWQLLRQLEGSPGRSLQELVDNIPDDYPKNARTVRRDLEALEAVGFPLVTERRHGQTRWRLMEGFRDILALGFSATELMALLLSRNLLKPLEGTEIAASLNSALGKASLRCRHRGTSMFGRWSRCFPSASVHIKAIASTAKPSISSPKPSTNGVPRKCATSRLHETAPPGARSIPTFLRFAGGGLYLIGHCHLRKEVRMFAVERIRTIALTDHPYQIPLDFKVDDYVQDALGVMRSGRRIEVELLFSKKAAAWVKDKTWHPSQQVKLLKDGRLKMTLKVADNEELVGWVLSFGGEARVVQPEALRQKVREEAKHILGSKL